MVTKVSSNSFDINSLYSPKIRELQMKPYQDQVAKAEAASQLSNEKSLALLELQQLTSKLTKAVSSFTQAKNSAFDLKSAGATTNDVGDGSDYVNVIANNTAVSGQTDIRVNRVATASFFTVGLDGAGNGFPPAAPIGNMGNYIATFAGGAAFDVANPPQIEITLAGGITYNVNVSNATDTIYNIRDYINNQLSVNNIKADVIKNANGEFLAISSTDTGKKRFTCFVCKF